MPTVGRASIDVDADLDDASFRRVGQQLQASLSASSGTAFRAIAKQAEIAFGRSVVGISLVAALSAPAASAISALAGAATALGSALSNASKSLFSFAGILGTILQVVKTATFAFKGFGDAVTADTPEKLTEALKNMSPAMQEAVLATRGLSGEWLKLRQAVQEEVFANFGENIKALGGTFIPILKDSLTDTGEILNTFFTDLTKFATSGDFATRFGLALDRNNQIFLNLKEIAIPFLDGLLNLFLAIQPAASRMAFDLAAIAENFRAWTAESGRAESIDAMMRSAEETGSKLLEVIKNVAGAVGDIFGAAEPAGNQFLDMLIKVTERFEKFTSSAEGQSQIAEWAEAGVAAMGLLGSIIESFGKAFAALSSSATFEKAAEVFQKLGDIFVLIAPALQFVSNLLLGALSGALSGIIKVVTGVINVFTGFKDLIVGIFTGDMSKALGGLGKIFSGAFGIVVGVIQTLFNVTIVGLLRRGVVGILKSFVGLFTSLPRLALNGFKALVNGFKTGFTTARSTVKAGIDAVIAFFKSMPKTLSGIGNGVVVALKELAKKAFNALKTGFSKIPSVGKDIIKGLVGGILGNAADVVNAIKKIAKQALDGALKFLGIDSPSKVFADQIGKQIPAGIAQGILGNMNVVDKALTTMPTSVPAPAGAAGGGLGGAMTAPASFVYAPNFYGPQTGTDRKIEWDWTMRYGSVLGVEKNRA
jgi:phage-related protein